MGKKIINSLDESINTGFFAHSTILSSKQKRTFNKEAKTLCVLNRINCNRPIQVNVTEILSVLGYEALKEHIHRLSKDSNIVDFKQTQKNIEDEIKTSCEAFRKGIIIGIKEKFLETAYLFLPFLRFSLVSHSFIYTYFFLMEYVDGTSEFVLIEQLPNYDFINSNLDLVANYCRNSIESVRYSIFSGNIYTYFPDKNATSSDLQVNYILNNVIKKCFGIYADTNKDNFIIASNNELTCTINKHKKIKFSETYSIPRVGIELKKDYYTYMSDCISSIIFYNIHRHAEAYILKQMKKNEASLSDLEKIHLYFAFETIKAFRKEKRIALKPEIENWSNKEFGKKIAELYKVLAEPFAKAYVEKTTP